MTKKRIVINNYSCPYNNNNNNCVPFPYPIGFQGPRGFQGFQGIIGEEGVQGFQGPAGEAPPLPDISFSVDKSGTQTIPATPSSFTFTTVTDWAQLGIGSYNTGSFNETTGVFTAPLTGKYQFTGTVQCAGSSGIVDPGSVICLRLTFASGGIQLAEQRVNAETFYSPNSGVCLIVSHQCLLNAGDTVTLDVSYVTTGPALGVSVDPQLGLTCFQGNFFAP